MVAESSRWEKLGARKRRCDDAGNARTEAVRGKRETRDTLSRKNPRKRRGWRQRFNFSVIARQVWRVPDSTLSTRRPLHSLVLDRGNRHSAELRFSCGVSPRIPRPRRSGSSFSSHRTSLRFSALACKIVFAVFLFLRKGWSHGTKVGRKFSYSFNAVDVFQFRRRCFKNEWSFKARPLHFSEERSEINVARGVGE